MIKPKDPRELAVKMMKRSNCAVRVGAVITDKRGIVCWGWNSMGPDGYGMHAEHHAIWRANPTRLPGAKVYVASERTRNGKIVTSRPCPDCYALLKKVGINRMEWRDQFGGWIWEGIR